jgi:hypothetical protein
MLGALAVMAAGCSNSTSPTSTTSTTTSTTTPTTTETFASNLAVGGFAYYTFNIVTNGTVNVTLTNVRGAGVPPTVQLGLGIGTPSTGDCNMTSQVVAGTGSTAPQLTGTFGPGTFCVRVFDVGNLAGPASFTATIAHS